MVPGNHVKTPVILKTCHRYDELLQQHLKAVHVTINNNNISVKAGR